MPHEYKHHHYVPIWYQKRFALPGQNEPSLYYLDLRPGFIIDRRGICYPKRAVRRWGPRPCFVEDDLYTVTFAGVESIEVEKVFFGQIDNETPAILNFWSKYTTFHDYDPRLGDPGVPLRKLLLHMSTQKLRTPKGLAWLAENTESESRGGDRTRLLESLIHLRALYSAVWAECVWQIADASASETKFILSDHPVTVYNRRCGPGSHWCRGFNDPDIRFQATHTIFPLSLDKVLLLTNLSWARDPYQREFGMRPNPSFFRDAMFNYERIQTLRHLNEEEVRQINFIIKSRSLRYVAAAREDWLYPEKYVSKAEWSSYGSGWLLMPDPRALHVGGTVVWGSGNRSGGALDEYGRPPWDRDFERETNLFAEARSLYRFQGEFAKKFGPDRRGQCTELGRRVERDSDDMHSYYLSLADSHK